MSNEATVGAAGNWNINGSGNVATNAAVFQYDLTNIPEGEICFDSFAMEFRIFSLLTSFKVYLNLIIRHLIHFDEVLWHFMSCLVWVRVFI